MALFHKLKNLFSDAGKNTSTVSDTDDTVKEVPYKEAGSQKSDGDDAAEVQADEPEPEIGSEEYLLYELNQNSDLFPDDAATVGSRVNSILGTVRDRISQVRRYAEWEEEQKLIAGEEQDEAGAGEEKVPPVKPADAEARVFCSNNRMTGFVYCLAPVGDGAGITAEFLIQAISAAGIQYGIDGNMISKIVESGQYYRIFAIARGTAPVKGEDGRIIDHFSRSQEIRLKEDEKGNIDHKNPGVFQSVQKGEIICDLIQPEDGTDGSDVMGRRLAAERGKMPPVPKGKNTYISEDGSALIADADGDISFQGSVFRVEPQLIVSQNVDNTTGNINFAGDIVINGEIRRGFCVTAGGRLIVHGLVEGAVLTAGDDIILKKGMNGSNGGSLTAKGSVYSRFLEQTKIVAGGDVVADVMINCDVSSGGSILATAGKGIVIGGKLRASQCVEAKRIGNQSETNTVIRIGVSTQKKENINDVEKELKAARNTLANITKNYNYLNSLSAIPEKNRAIYQTLVEQKRIYEELVAKLETDFNALQNKKIDYGKCHVRGDIIYGVTEVTLNSNHIFVRDTTSKCNIYYSEEQGELVIGTF